MGKSKLTKSAFDFVVQELAVDMPPSVICDNLIEKYGITFASSSVCSIRSRNPEMVEAKRKELQDHVPIAEKWTRLEHRRRQAMRLEQKVRAGGKGYLSVEKELRECWNDIAQEMGEMKSGASQTNITNVHQGPEESWRTVDKGYRERRVKRE